MTKVVMLVPSLQEKGPVIVAEKIARWCPDKTVTFTFVSLRNNSQEDQQRAKRQGLDFVEIGMGGFPKPAVVLRFIAVIKQLAPDVIHAHCFWPVVFAAFLLPGFSKIVTLHNNPLEDYRLTYGRVAGFLMSQVYLFSLRFMNRVVAISEYVRDVHKHRGFDHKMVVVYNGIEDCYIETKVIKLGGELILASAAVLVPLKNLITGIKAVKAICDKGYKVKYYIIGDGPEKMQLQQYVNENKLNNAVFFLGQLPRENGLKHLSIADAILAPSLSEGLPLAVVEALMLKKPVILSNIPAMQVLVKHGCQGYLCDALDERQYYAAIIALFDVKRRQKMATNARKTYLAKFTVQDMARGYALLYTD